MVSVIAFSSNNLLGLASPFNGQPPPTVFSRSTNGGYNWIQYYTTQYDQPIYPMVWVNGTSVIYFTIQDYNTNNSYIYKSSDNGLNWYVIRDTAGTAFYGIDAVKSNDKIYAWITSGSGHLIYKLIDTAVAIGIQNIGSGIPSEFKLYQNYPNPFNPITKVKFDVPKPGDVQLTIYDVLGREITQLVNRQLKPGTFEIEWDGTNYPSGVYIYRIKTEAVTDSKKMVLIR